MNLQEALYKITELQHLAGVYEELIDHLSQFLPTDVGEPEAELILEDCIESKVSTDAVDNAQQFLQDKKEEIDKQLLTLNKMRVTSGQTAKKKSSPKKSTKK